MAVDRQVPGAASRRTAGRIRSRALGDVGCLRDFRATANLTRRSRDGSRGRRSARRRWRGRGAARRAVAAREPAVVCRSRRRSTGASGRDVQSQCDQTVPSCRDRRAEQFLRSSQPARPLVAISVPVERQRREAHRGDAPHEHRPRRERRAGNCHSPSRPRIAARAPAQRLGVEVALLDQVVGRQPARSPCSGKSTTGSWKTIASSGSCRSSARDERAVGPPVRWRGPRGRASPTVTPGRAPRARPRARGSPTRPRAARAGPAPTAHHDVEPVEQARRAPRSRANATTIAIRVHARMPLEAGELERAGSNPPLVASSSAATIDDAEARLERPPPWALRPRSGCGSSGRGPRRTRTRSRSRPRTRARRCRSPSRAVSSRSSATVGERSRTGARSPG